MYRPNLRIHLPAVQLAGVFLALAFTACEKHETTSYRIPKEELTYSAPTAPAGDKESPTTAPQDASTSGGMRMLPGMQAAANAAPGVTYSLPEGWQDLGASGMRKANLLIADASGDIEVTALTFPGDVGGLTANINRWAGQVDLPAYPEKEIETIAVARTISKHQGHYVRLIGTEQSILAGILPFHGSTWFFKMKGPTEATIAQEKSMMDFLDSIEVEDTHH
jgi:hypothetical protein